MPPKELVNEINPVCNLDDPSAIGWHHSAWARRGMCEGCLSRRLRGQEWSCCRRPQRSSGGWKEWGLLVKSGPHDEWVQLVPPTCSGDECYGRIRQHCDQGGTIRVCLGEWTSSVQLTP